MHKSIQKYVYIYKYKLMKNQKLIQTNTNIDIYTTYEFLFFSPHLK